MDYYSVSILINILMEVGLVYIVFFVISKLILIPGKKKLQNVTDLKGYKEKEREIKKARLLLSLIGTIIIIAINLIMLILKGSN